MVTIGPVDRVASTSGLVRVAAPGKKAPGAAYLPQRLRGVVGPTH
jgi:hypothetical protein